MRLAEHIEEDGLGEGVKFGESGAAFGAQRLGLVQNLREPPLFPERGSWNKMTAKFSEAQVKQFMALFRGVVRVLLCR